MVRYNIAGVEVDFPFDAYDVQLMYMEKVVLALEVTLWLEHSTSSHASLACTTPASR